MGPGFRYASPRMTALARCARDWIPDLGYASSGMTALQRRHLQPTQIPLLIFWSSSFDFASRSGRVPILSPTGSPGGFV